MTQSPAVMLRWRSEGASACYERLRADTADVKPVVATSVVRIQVGTTVSQVPAISTARRVVRPPVPVPGIVESTPVVVAASDRAKRRFVRSCCGDLRVARQGPTFRTDRGSSGCGVI